MKVASTCSSRLLANALMLDQFDRDGSIPPNGSSAKLRLRKMSEKLTRTLWPIGLRLTIGRAWITLSVKFCLTAFSSGVPGEALKWMLRRTSCTRSPARLKRMTHSSPKFIGWPTWPRPRAIAMGASNGTSNWKGLISA